jgi:hypothetical protein
VKLKYFKHQETLASFEDVEPIYFTHFSTPENRFMVPIEARVLNGRTVMAVDDKNLVF